MIGLSRRIRVLAIGVSLAFPPALCEAQQAYLIGTVAGGGPPPTPSPAVSVSLGPAGVGPATADARGNVYFSADNFVFKVDTGGVLTRVAGESTVAGYSGDGGPATSARLSLQYSSGVAVDSAGNLYISDSGNQVIRKVTAATGIITTVAGSGAAGYSGDGGPATKALLYSPAGVAVDGSGNLFIADYLNNAIREVAAGTGIITTIAGIGTYGYSGDGGPGASAQLGNPTGLAVDSAGNLYLVDNGNGRIRKVEAATGIITTVAGNGASGYSGDGGAATNAELDIPEGLAVDSSGNLYIADTFNFRIREVAAATGIITTVAGGGMAGLGDGGPATSADLVGPGSVAADASGDLYISDGNRIRKVTAATGIISTFAGDSSLQYSGDGGPATSAQLALSQILGGEGAGLCLDSSGNLYIADTFNYRVRMVAAATGIITTVAGGGAAGLGDGGLATSAQLTPFGVAVDGLGNLFIADIGYYRIRKVAAGTGIITTVAGNGSPGYSGDGGSAVNAGIEPLSVAVDGSGNLFIADGSGRVREVSAATGVITTVAGGGTSVLGDGGPATSAQLLLPYSVALDGSGNLYIADTTNFRIRKVAAATGIITTVAGNSTSGYSGDGGPATSAQLDYPSDVRVDGSGNLYIAENWNIRKVSAATGIITTLFGGGSGTSTSEFPIRVAVGNSGQVFFADETYNVVTLINDSGAPAAEVTAGNVASSDHLTFNLLIDNPSASQQSAVASSVRVLSRAALSANNTVTVGGTVQITELLARDPSAPDANNVVVGVTVPPTYVITNCLANGVPCPVSGGNATVTYPVLGSGQPPSITLIADGPTDAAAQIGLSSTSDSEDLATASFSQTVAASPGATITPSFQGPSGIAAGQGIEYTVALPNSGGAALAQDPITVVVALDPSLVSTSVQADASMWTCAPPGARITCTDISGLAAGGEIGFTVNAVVPPAAGGRNLSSSATLTFGGQVVTQNVGSTVAGGQSIPAFFTGEVYAGSGVYDLQLPDGKPFGYFNYVSTSILYHYDMGYEAFIPGSSADVYLYDFTSSHWLYASSACPYLYDFTLNTWLYYFPDSKNPGHYTTNPRYFSNLTTGKIFTM